MNNYTLIGLDKHDSVGDVNEHFTKSFNLMDKLLEDFASDEFKLEDINELYNDFSQRYRKSHLDTLKSIGLLDYDSQQETYSINYSCPYIAQIQINPKDMNPLDDSFAKDFLSFL